MVGSPRIVPGGGNNVPTSCRIAGARHAALRLPGKSPHPVVGRSGFDGGCCHHRSVRRAHQLSNRRSDVHGHERRRRHLLALGTELERGGGHRRRLAGGSAPDSPGQPAFPRPELGEAPVLPARVFVPSEGLSPQTAGDTIELLRARLRELETERVSPSHREGPAQNELDEERTMLQAALQALTVISGWRGWCLGGSARGQQDFGDCRADSR